MTRSPWSVAIVCALPLSALIAEDTAPIVNRVLNALETPSVPGLAAWEVVDLATRLAAGVEPKLGAAAIEIAGTARVAGGKIDAPLFDGPLPGCARVSLWIDGRADGNLKEVGIQVRDAQDEWLLRTVPVDWTGWRRVDIDPRADGFRQAFEQKDKDGKVTLPLRSVHLVAFSAAPGAMAVVVDGLTAATAPDASDTGVRLSLFGGDVAEPGQPAPLRALAENRDAAERQVVARWALQADANDVDAPMPDPALGVDHALGCASTVSLDGAEPVDAKLCDGDDDTAYGTPWGKGFKEAVATIDLGKPRDISAVRWRAGDANWIHKADCSTSLDGAAFTPVEGAQGVDLHGKWAPANDIPWPKPVSARWLRLRFHDDGKPANSIQLPPTVMVYDGIANDRVAVPTVGPVVASGEAKVAVPAGDFAELALPGSEALKPGCYLLGLNLSLGGRDEVRWSHLYVRPADTVDPERARRFGVNGADIGYAAEMRRCGFGWMRFENAKWMMYMPAKDRVAFDGSVEPWHVNLDAIFAAYQGEKLHVLPYIFQTPEWATSAPKNVDKNRAAWPPRDNADYGEAVFQLVARYGRAKVDAAALTSADKKTGLGEIDAVELWNEPNLNDPGWGPYVGTLAQYFETMRAGAEGARRADPSLPVSSCGWAGIDLEVIGRMAEYRYADGKTPLDLVDIVNGHFYSGRQDPETCDWDVNVDRGEKPRGGFTIPDQLEDLVAWRDALKPKAELWITETGNDVGGPIGRDERYQAAKIPRAMMLALAAGIDRVFLYRESGSDPSMHAGAGLARNDRSIRPSWFTVATMIRQLQGFTGRALRLPTADANVWALLWEDGDRRLVTAWSIAGGGAAGGETALGLDLGGGTQCDAFGHAAPLERLAGAKLGYFPSYLTIAKPSAGLAKIIADARERAAARVAERARLSAAPMRLFDFGSAEHLGMLRGQGMPRRFTAVGKDTLWDEKLGYGLSAPAAGEEDQHWIRDALERDGVRIGPKTAFRLRLEPGRHRLRVSATPVGGNDSVAVTVTAGAEQQTKELPAKDHVGEFTIAGGDQPIEVSLGGWGVLRWLTAIPEAAP